LRASLPADAAAAIEKLSGVQAELSKRLYATDVPDRARHEREIHDLREQRNALTDELRGSLNSFWSRLPNTADEAQTVNDLFEASLADGERLLTGDQPTEERLKRELPRHAFVHLATHGFFHPAGTVSMWDSARDAAQKNERDGAE